MIRLDDYACHVLKDEIVRVVLESSRYNLVCFAIIFFVLNRVTDNI